MLSLLTQAIHLASDVIDKLKGEGANSVVDVSGPPLAVSSGIGTSRPTSAVNKRVRPGDVDHIELASLPPVGFQQWFPHKAKDKSKFVDSLLRSAFSPVD